MATSKLYDLIGAFATIPNTVIEMMPVIGPEAFCLFSFLRYRTNSNTGDAFPSYDNIHNGTGLTRRKIARAIRVLESVGLVERKRRFSGSTIYTLKLPDPPISTNGDTTISNPVVTTISNPVVTLTTPNEQDKINQTESSAKNAPGPKPRQRDLMFDAIITITGVDPTIKSAAVSVGKVKRELLQASPPYTPDDVIAFGVWWNLDEWRKKNGPPACHQITQKIGVMRNGKVNHAITSSTRPDDADARECAEQINARNGRA